MSRFNPKDLSYDQSLPPFLAALRGQLTGDGRGADPILAGRRRAVKKRSASEEAEDAPLVVDERGHVVGGVTVGKDGAVAENKAADKTIDEAKDEKKDETKDEPKDDVNVAFGAGKKRRVGKVVGGDEYEAAERDLKRKRVSKKDGVKDESDTKDKKDKKDKKKEKKKKIQLSFEDEEEG